MECVKFADPIRAIYVSGVDKGRMYDDVDISAESTGNAAAGDACLQAHSMLAAEEEGLQGDAKRGNARGGDAKKRRRSETPHTPGHAALRHSLYDEGKGSLDLWIRISARAPYTLTLTHTFQASHLMKS